MAQLNLYLNKRLQTSRVGLTNYCYTPGEAQMRQEYQQGSYYRGLARNLIECIEIEGSAETGDQHRAH